VTPEEHLDAALRGLGFGPDDEMAATPSRVTKMLAAFVPTDPPPPLNPLPTRSRDAVVVRDLPYYSLCAHHLLPFFGHCTIAYQPSDRIAGLGWFPRVLAHLAQQPQLQERLCAQLADTIWEGLAPQAVGVRLTARQMCVEMRGPRSPGLFETHTWRGAPSPELSHMLR